MWAADEPAPDGPCDLPDAGPECDQEPPAPGGGEGSEPAAPEPSSEPAAPDGPDDLTEPAPTVTETVTVTPAPVVLPSENLTAEDGSQVVSLSDEHMAVLLLGLALTVCCLGAMTVRSFMPGGD